MFLLAASLRRYTTYLDLSLRRPKRPSVLPLPTTRQCQFLTNAIGCNISPVDQHDANNKRKASRSLCCTPSSIQFQDDAMANAPPTKTIPYLFRGRDRVTRGFTARRALSVSTASVTPIAASLTHRRPSALSGARERSHHPERQTANNKKRTSGKTIRKKVRQQLLLQRKPYPTPLP